MGGREWEVRVGGRRRREMEREGGREGGGVEEEMWAEWEDTGWCVRRRVADMKEVHV